MFNEYDHPTWIMLMLPESSISDVEVGKLTYSHTHINGQKHSIIII